MQKSLLNLKIAGGLNKLRVVRQPPLPSLDPLAHKSGSFLLKPSHNLGKKCLGHSLGLIRRLGACKNMTVVKSTGSKLTPSRTSDQHDRDIKPIHVDHNLEHAHGQRLRPVTNGY